MSISRLYVSGLWIIPGNLKRNRQHYLDLLPETFELLRGQKLAFYCDADDVKKSAIDLAQQLGITLFIQHVSLAELPYPQLIHRNSEIIRPGNFDVWARAFQGLGSNEKALNQLRFQSDSTNTSYPQLVTCWTSKPFLIGKAISNYDYTEYVWVDASLARYDFKIIGDFRRWVINSEQLSHYSSRMKLFGKRQPLRGGCLGARKATWLRVIAAYDSTFHDFFARKCPHPVDDEILFALCEAKYPELFHCTNPTRTWLHKVIGKIIWNLRLTSFINRALN